MKAAHTTAALISASSTTTSLRIRQHSLQRETLIEVRIAFVYDYKHAHLEAVGYDTSLAK